ncbi:YbaK/prolyl-tRNA synthetase associated region [Burkholderiales bacterium]|nr:YbaK/prolyl-tRNA synthetase associated region [Burkholderiales bacterium]
MSIPLRLADYLERCGARYEICAHEHSRCSAETARIARVPAHQIAKSVIIEDDDGCVMAVVPADRYVKLGQLSRMLDRKRLRLAQESRIATLFADCDLGAVPAVGMAWDLETVVDEELEASEFVYIEGGDHERLLRMSQDQFQELMRAAQHGHFCGATIH